MLLSILLVGGLVLTLILTTGFGLDSASEELQTTFNTSQNLFVKSQRVNVSPPPLRIVESSVLQSNRTPSVIQPQTLGAITSREQRTDIVKYEVERGDTVTSIAEEFNLETETVLWANDLGSNSTINPGDELVILPVDGVLHPVREGESISSIAATYEVEAKEIVDYNELESKASIYAGDTLIIPGGEQPATISIAKQTPVGKSYFIPPVQGVITQGRHGSLNNAVDIANNCGSPVVAAAGGTVKAAGYAGIGGKRVTIKHSNGVVTYYGHLRYISVVPGQKVSQGTIIGEIGHTGLTFGPTGCHVHYTMRRANNPLAAYPVGSSLSWGQ